MMKRAITWNLPLFACLLAGPLLNTSCHKDEARHEEKGQPRHTTGTDDDDHDTGTHHHAGEEHGQNKMVVTRPLKKGSSGKRVGRGGFEFKFAEMEKDGDAVVGEVTEASGGGFQ